MISHNEKSQGGQVQVWCSSSVVSSRTRDLYIQSTTLPSAAYWLYVLPHGHKMAVVAPNIMLSNQPPKQKEKGRQKALSLLLYFPLRIDLC